MIAWPVLSYNAYNTSYLMGIVRIKRVYLKIPSIDEHTYTILLETLQSVVLKTAIKVYSTFLQKLVVERYIAQ